MFYEIAKAYKLPYYSFHTYPPISDRISWSLPDPEWQKDTIALGEAYLGFSYPYLTAADYLDFTKTGNRSRYEEKFFSKRLALNALVLAECTENEGRFTADIVNGIYALCDEAAWWLPPHNSYRRDSPQLPLPDVTAPILDLFACETGAILATVYYLMKQVLEKISPLITKRILFELRQRIFIPYLNCHFWWMGDGEEPTNNWTIWCTQNILISAFLTCSDNHVKRRIFLKACQSIDYFLKDYAEDGCCDEGALYYRHAGLCLFNAMELCDIVTSGQFKALYHNEKIRNIAAFIYHAHIDDKYYFNFADCSPIAGRAGVREFLFALRTGNEEMARFAAIDFQAGLPDTLLLASENNLYYRLQNAFTIAKLRDFPTNAPLHHPDIYYPGTGIFCTRDTNLYLAVKAGCNAGSHAHNDSGSFIIYKNGKPLFIDIGVETYTQKTFSPERYDIWTMQSAYHNLPTINGFMQKAGNAYRSRKVHCHTGDSVCGLEMDIAGAYPSESGLQSYHRQALLYKGKEIIIKDCFLFKPSADLPHMPDRVTLNLITCEKPVFQPSSNDTTAQIGTLGTLKIYGATLKEIEEIPIEDARLMLAWKQEIYRIILIAEQNEIVMKIS